MWDGQKRERLEQLRQRQQQNTLTEAEQTDLVLLVQELEAAEAAYLTPATQRLREDRENMEKQNRALEDLTLRKEALLNRLREFLTAAQAERRVIDSELATVLAGSRAPETNE
jgi:hypothetical protein